MMDRATTQIEEEQKRIEAAAQKGENADEEEMFNYDKPIFTYEDYTEFQDFLSQESLDEEEET